MKNRTILFGYAYRDGKITVYQTEADTVRRIYSEYLGGKSLKQIAQTLNCEQVEYLPGSSGWNKARLMRVLDDKRYLGNDEYPAITDADTHGKIQVLKTGRNNLRQTDLSADIYQVNASFICPVCGDVMKRRSDMKRKCKSWWTCERNECRHIVQIENDELIRRLTEQMNGIIRNPALLRRASDSTAEPSIALRRLENEISRTLEGFNINKIEFRQKLLECFSMKYAELDSTEQITEMLISEFKETDILTTFTPELFNRIVKAVRFHGDNNITLIMKNGHEIGKENEHNGYGNDTPPKGSARNTA